MSKSKGKKQSKSTQDITTLRVSVRTRELLGQLAKYGESMDNVLYHLATEALKKTDKEKSIKL